MNKILAILYLFAAASAYSAPLVLDKNTAKDDRVAKYYYYRYPAYGSYDTTLVRFAYLLPKLGADVTGLSTSGSTAPKPLSFLVFNEGEVLNHLLAFSDCKSWYGVLAEFYSAAVGSYYKVYGYYDKALYLDLPSLASFLHDKLTSDYYKGLVEAGLPSHPLVHLLAKYY
ncbi:hypothetical protein MACK_003442 [Theileria orientalis]|uniref:Uncharacterized protein n=1 Tax=Theileria orientalis TaxID=68886 RepID=A0A976XJV7_THEOR|nr:hypothetical protein MACK_003442 [Theileria orientalis]